MKTATLAFLSVLFFTVSAQAGMLSAPAKIAAKIFGRRSASVATRVVTHHGDDAVKVVSHYGDDAAKAVSHYGDDAAKAVVKGGGEMALHSAPKVSSAVDAAVAAAKAESAAAKPLSKTAAVLEAVKPKLVIAGGAGVATVVGANNLTSGSREVGKATAEAIRTNPELASQRIETTGSCLTELARESGKGVGYAGMGVAGFFGCLGLGLLLKMALPPILNRKRLRDARKEPVPEAA